MNHYAGRGLESYNTIKYLTNAIKRDMLLAITPASCFVHMHYVSCVLMQIMVNSISFENGKQTTLSIDFKVMF